MEATHDFKQNYGMSMFIDNPKIGNEHVSLAVSDKNQKRKPI
jgi:hypothetical protein